MSHTQDIILLQNEKMKQRLRKLRKIETQVSERYIDQIEKLKEERNYWMERAFKAESVNQ